MDSDQVFDHRKFDGGALQGGTAPTDIATLFRQNCVHYNGNYEVTPGQALRIASILEQQGIAAARAEADELARRVAAETANRQDGFRLLLDARGVRNACNGCRGLGTRVYGSTSTWRGGIGGQAMTNDVCDKCWGSGDSERKWPSHAEMKVLRVRAEMEKEKGNG